jgi:phosphate transport system permease protein
MGRHRGDRIFRASVRLAGWLPMLVLGAVAVFLLVQAWPALTQYGPGSSLGSVRWAPSEATTDSGQPNPYGVGQFVYGSAVTATLGMLFAVPVAVAVALFLTEIGPYAIRRTLAHVVDLLAAIPSVVYGFWAVFALMPTLRPFGGFLADTVGQVPVVGALFDGPFYGYSYLAAGIVLAIMVLPIITAICREVFSATPVTEKEAALALGATRWEMVRMAVLPRARAGIVGACVLGLGRAIGETIAVTMVIGNDVTGITASLLAPGATMPSVIANELTEASQPLHLESLFVVATWLLALALVVNVAGRLMVRRRGTVPR